MLQVLGRLNIRAEICEATDGHTEPHLSEFRAFEKLPLGADSDTDRELMREKKELTSPGAWGHLKVFRTIIKDMISKGYSRILVLEDDVIFIRDFHEKFLDLTRELSGVSWKILMAGAGQHHWKIPEDLRYGNSGITDFDPSIPFYYPVNTLGSFALGLDLSVAEDYIKSLERMKCNGDRALHPLFRRWYRHCFVAVPNLVISDVSDSNITPKGNNDQRSYQKKQKWDITRYDFPFQPEMVSIIVPMYNAGATIAQAVRSLTRQTYREIEIIVVDDGSSDESGEIVKLLAATDPRIRYFRNETNRGCYCSRNTGIRASKGKYIAFQDADDISLTTRIAHQLIPLVGRRAKLSLSKILRSNRRIAETDFHDDASLLNFVHSVPTEKDHPSDTRPVTLITGLATTMYDRQLFEKYGLYWEERFSADAEFLERLLYHECNLRFPIDGLPAHKYLALQKKIDHLFEYIDDTLYICLPRADSNLSAKYSLYGSERENFRIKYRKRLLGETDYQYPHL